MGIEGFRKAILKQMNLNSIIDENKPVYWEKVIDWIREHIQIEKDTISQINWSNLEFPTVPILLPKLNKKYTSYFFDFNCTFYFSRTNGLNLLFEEILEQISKPTVKQYYQITSYITILFFTLVVHELGILTRSSSLYIAIDGIPPQAKHMGKKKKWLKRAIIDNLKYHIIPKTGYINDVRIFAFGTGFMDYFQKELENFTKKISEKYKLAITISDSNYAGEGETKIISHLLERDTKEEEDFFIWSPDSDIIIHALLAYLKIKNKQNDISLFQFEPVKSHLYTIKIQNLYDSLIENFKYRPELNSDQVIRDICLLFAMIGNDFVPSFKCLLKNHWYELLKLTYHQYQDKYPQRHFLNSKHGKCRLNIENFFNYLETLLQYEKILLKEHYLYQYLENYREFWFYWQKLIKSSKNDPDKIKHLKEELVLNYKKDGHHELFLVVLLILKKTTYNEFGDIISTDEKLDYVNLCDKKKQFNYLLTYFQGKSSYQCYPDRLLSLIKENPDLPLEEVVINNGYLEYHDILNGGSNELTLDTIHSDNFPPERSTDPSEIKNKNNAYLEFIIWYIEYYYNLVTIDKWYYPFEETPLLKELVKGKSELLKYLGTIYNNFGPKRKRVQTLTTREEQVSRLVEIFTYIGDDNYMRQLLITMFNLEDDELDYLQSILDQKQENNYIKTVTQSLIEDQEQYYEKYGLADNFPNIYGSFKIEISICDDNQHQIKIIDRHKRLILLNNDFEGHLSRQRVQLFLKEHLKFQGEAQLYLYPKRGQNNSVLVPINYTFVNQILNEKANIFTCLLHIPKPNKQDLLTKIEQDQPFLQEKPLEPKFKTNSGEKLSWKLTEKQLPRYSNSEISNCYLNKIRINRKKLLWGNYSQLFLLESFYGQDEYPEFPLKNQQKETLPEVLTTEVTVGWEQLGEYLYLTMTMMDKKHYAIKHPFNSKEWMTGLKKGILRLINDIYCYQGINYEITSHSKLPIPLKYVCLDWGEKITLKIEIIHRKRLPEHLKFQIKYQKYQNLVTFYHGGISTVTVDNENMVTNEYLKKIVLNYLFQRYYIQKAPLIYLYRPNLTKHQPYYHQTYNHQQKFYQKKSYSIGYKEQNGQNGQIEPRSSPFDGQTESSPMDVCSIDISTTQYQHDDEEKESSNSYYNHRQIFDINRTKAVNILIDIETYLP